MNTLTILLLILAVALCGCDSSTSSPTSSFDSTYLHSFTKIQITLDGVFDLEQDLGLVRDTGILFSISNQTSMYGYPTIARIRWNASGFIVDTSINWSYTSRNETGGGGRTYNYTGVISENNTLEIKASYTYGDYLHASYVTVRDIALRNYLGAKDLRFLEQSDTSLTFGGTISRDNIDSVHWSTGRAQYYGDYLKTFSTFIWDATPAPSVRVMFHK